MTRRVPIVATIVVALAALLMVRLGFWQLHRLHEKEALLARYAANLSQPPLPLAALYPVREDALYRRSSAMCLEPTGWKTEAGRTTTGQTGWRHIAFCRTGAEGPGIAVDVGVSQSPKPPVWGGGPVSGRITWVPTVAPLVERMFITEPAHAPMIVSTIAAPGLIPTAQPDPGAIPNNHLSYAVQWFIFAALAVGIYGIALARRGVFRAARRVDERPA